MSWFAHTCWFCGHKSKDVEIVDAGYQCKHRDACLRRRVDRYPWEARDGEAT